MLGEPTEELGQPCQAALPTLGPPLERPGERSRPAVARSRLIHEYQGETFRGLESSSVAMERWWHFGGKGVDAAPNLRTANRGHGGS